MRGLGVWLGALLAGALVVGCGDDGASPESDATPGVAGGPCYPNATCNAGLECASGVCVDLSGVAGTVGRPCYPNATCNAGLACEADICVVAGGGPDVDADDGGSPEDGGTPDDGGAPDDGTAQHLGTECTADSECPADSWCSTVSDYRRCSPRVFSGTAHQLDFVFVPSGTFQQGTQGAVILSERPYTATISRNYFVSRTEVTQGQWKAATGGTNGSCFQSTTGTPCTASNVNNNGPVEQVDWYSALAYANWLSVNQGLSACYTLSGCTDATSGWHDGEHSDCTGATFVGLTCTGYRLLTESEWERAARGNTTSTYYWGEVTDTATVILYAWFDRNAGGRTQAVGGIQANAFGLYDMSGNVREWVWDWVYNDSGIISYPSGSATDYLGPSSGSARGIRGGSLYGDASFLRSALRSASVPSDRGDGVGFRLARTAN